VKEHKVKPLWAILTVLAAFPATGLICAITYNDTAMFYWSLVFIPIAIAVFPFAVLVTRPVMLLALIMRRLAKLERRKK
jgi:hypothetical protein